MTGNPAIVFIDGNLYNEFKKSPIIVAALALHEAIYAFSRKSWGNGFPRQTDSDEARKIVATLFSDEKFGYGDDSMNNPTGFYSLVTSLDKKLSIRLTSFKNKANFYVDSFSMHGCDVTPQQSCSYPLKLTDGSFYFRYNVLSKSSFLGIVEIFENGKSVYEKDISFNKGSDFMENFRFSVPYEEAFESYIMSLKI